MSREAHLFGLRILVCQRPKFLNRATLFNGPQAAGSALLAANAIDLELSGHPRDLSHLRACLTDRQMSFQNRNLARRIDDRRSRRRRVWAGERGCRAPDNQRRRRFRLTSGINKWILIGDPHADQPSPVGHFALDPWSKPGAPIVAQGRSD
jgi:hypothetical protein